MSSSLYVATERERRIAAILRARAIEEIERRGDAAEVARLLNIMPAGVRSLLDRNEWELELAFRVAEGLGIDVVNQLESAVA